MEKKDQSAVFPHRCLRVNKKVQKKNAEISAGQKREGQAGEDEEFGEKRKRSSLRKTLFCSVDKPEENRENEGRSCITHKCNKNHKCNTNHKCNKN